MRFPPHLMTVLPSVAALLTLLVLFGPTLTAQRTGPPLDADQIVKQIGTEADAKAIFALVFAHLRADKTRALFLSSQIRPAWVPDDDQVVRLGDIDAQATLNNCGTYWIVSRVQHSDNVITLQLDSRCSAAGREYTVHYSGGRWRPGPPDLPEGHVWFVGTGSGFVGGPPPGCPCLPQG